MKNKSLLNRVLMEARKWASKEPSKATGRAWVCFRQMRFPMLVDDPFNANEELWHLGTKRAFFATNPASEMKVEVFPTDTVIGGARVWRER